MGCDRTFPAHPAAPPQRGAPPGIRPRCLDRHLACAEDRYTLGHAPARDGLWLRNDLLAPPSRLAKGGSLGSLAPSLAGSTRPIRPHRLESCLHRRLYRRRSRGGEKTGKNLTDRGKQGSKRHLMVDREGTPLTILLTAANVNETTMLEATLDAVQPIRGRTGRPRKRPDKLHADKGYDSKKNRAALRQRGITPRIARKGVESKQRLGRYRWVVERTHSWLNRFRRLKVRYERRADIHEAFLKIGCALICWKLLQHGFC